MNMNLGRANYTLEMRTHALSCMMTDGETGRSKDNQSLQHALTPIFLALIFFTPALAEFFSMDRVSTTFHSFWREAK